MSTTFFCTLRPSVGFINADSYQHLHKFLQKQHAYVISVEDKANMYTNGRHVHFSFLTIKPTRSDSIKRTLKVMMLKYYKQCQINVKTALTPAVINYIEKDNFIVDSHNRNLLIDYIQSDHVRNAEQVKILTDYKATRIRYAYDNKQTWSRFFKEYPDTTISDWKHTIIELDGTLPPCYFKLKAFYEYYNGKTEENDNLRIIKAQARDFKTFFTQQDQEIREKASHYQ